LKIGLLAAIIFPVLLLTVWVYIRNWHKKR